MTSVFILGSSGMLGKYVSKILALNYKTYEINRCLLNINKDITVNQIIDVLKSNCDNLASCIIVNCIGAIPQKDFTKDEFFIINSYFPYLLAQISLEFNCKVIHITTDCVYSGSKGNYSELDEKDALSIYGVSKNLGELGYVCNIRTSIIGEETSGKSLLEWIRNNKDGTINGYVNHHWNGVTCLQLAKIIKYMIDSNIYWKGIRHIYSPKPISKYTLCQIINRVYNLNIKIEPVENYTFVDRTLITLYPSFITIPSIEEQIEEQSLFDLK